MIDEKIEFLFGTMRFSPFWIGVDVCLALHFLFSWWISYKKTGWKLDFWHVTLLVQLIFPVLIMYPFNASIYNVLATGSDYDGLEGYVDQAFAISVVGYVSLWMGRYLYDLMQHRFPLSFMFKAIEPFGRLVERNIRNKKGVVALSIFSLAFGALTLSIAIGEGFFLNPRDFFLKDDLLRPLFNATISLFSIALSFLALQAVQYKDRLAIVLFAALTLFSIGFGLRGVTIMGLLLLASYSIYLKKGRVRLLRFAGVGVLLLISALYMSAIRNGDHNPALVLSQIFLETFYGNHFSDTRDFAWILSLWDGDYVWGRTYLAGLFSFLPRFLSPLRQEWSLSLYTNNLVGFDSSVHAGLRPGIFGEAFLNFSYFGVILLAFVAGYLLRYGDCKLRETITASKDVIKGYTQTLAFAFVSAFFISAAMWAFYIFIFINLLLSCTRPRLNVKPL